MWNHIEMKRGLVGLVALLAFWSVACEPVDSELGKTDDGQATMTEFLTAEDFDAVIVSPDILCLEGVIEAEFAEPNQMFGFPFQATAGATIAAGTDGDSDFDTIVMVFGPDDGEGYFGRFPIALDDDGGEGRLSSLEDYEIKEDGRYVLIVGTYGGEYRGTVRMHFSYNGVDGCGGEPEPEMVCCMFPYGPEPFPCWGPEGEAHEGEFDADGDGLPDDCGDDDYAFLPNGESMILPHEECIEMGGEPGPVEMCEEPPVPEEVCCILEMRWDEDPDCWDANGENRCDGEPEMFITNMDECIEMGGEPGPAEMCYEEPPMPEDVCCILREMWDDPECWGENGENYCGEERGMFITSLDDCVEMGGEPGPVEMCYEEPPMPEEVCCVMVWEDGVEDMFIASMEECVDMGGEPGPVEMCYEEPPVEEVCCVVYGDWDSADCWGPEGENWCGEPEMFITTEERCMEMGGEFLPVDECREPEPPQEEVCCVVFIGPDGVPCWDDNGDGLPDDECLQEPQMFITTADQCAEMGGEFLPVDECREPEPSEEQVCCFLIRADGTYAPELMLLDQCLEVGGEAGPVEECRDEPEPPQEEVCCFVTLDDGSFRTGWMAYDECVEFAGVIANEQLCEVRE